MKKKTIKWLLLILLLCLYSSLAQADITCPAGIGAEKGDEPTLKYKDIIICGYKMGSSDKNKEFISEFQVIDTKKNNKTLLEGDATETYSAVLDQSMGLVLTRYILLPVAGVKTIVLDGEKSSKTPFISYTVLSKKTGYELSPPTCAVNIKLSTQEINNIVNKADDLKKRLGKKKILEDEKLPYELLAAAMSGSKRAANMLTGNFYFKTDGSVAESASEAMSVFEEYERICKKH